MNRMTFSLVLKQRKEKEKKIKTISIMMYQLNYSSGRLGTTYRFPFVYLYPKLKVNNLHFMITTKIKIEVSILKKQKEIEQSVSICY